MSDPLRWTDAKGGAPGELRALLHHARGHAPPLPDAVRSASALAVARVASGGAWWAKKFAALKVLGAVAVVATGSVVGLQVATRSPTPTARHARPRPVAPPPPATMSARALTLPVADDPAPAPTVTILPAPAVAPRVVAATPSARAPVDEAEESDGLEHARASLRAGDSAGALALLHDHARRYPRSNLGDERDYLEFLARVHAAAGDEAAVAAAAQRYTARHPHGFYGAQVRAAVESSR